VPSWLFLGLTLAHARMTFAISTRTELIVAPLPEMASRTVG
jgi:hypothetical protein